MKTADCESKLQAPFKWLQNCMQSILEQAVSIRSSPKVLRVPELSLTGKLNYENLIIFLFGISQSPTVLFRR